MVWLLIKILIFSLCTLTYQLTHQAYLHRVLTEKDVYIIKHSPSKSCAADPFPTTLLKEILPTVSSALATIVNLSMQTGIFPDSLKEAWVKQLLKKITLDLNEKNYCPISNLQFSGELIKRAVINQLAEHLTSNFLMEHMQSAYCMGHSTESALTKVKSDILSLGQTRGSLPCAIRPVSSL